MIVLRPFAGVARMPREPSRFWVGCESDPSMPPWLVDMDDDGQARCSCQIIHNRTEADAACKHIAAVRAFLKQ